MLIPPNIIDSNVAFIKQRKKIQLRENQRARKVCCSGSLSLTEEMGLILSFKYKRKKKCNASMRDFEVFACLLSGFGEIEKIIKCFLHIFFLCYSM
jgi:hypothetical protein